MNWYKVISKNRKGEVTHLCNITAETKEQALIHAINIYGYLRIKGGHSFCRKVNSILKSVETERP